MLAPYLLPSVCAQGPRGLLFKEILPGLQPLLGTLREVAARRGKTVPQVAINWCMCKGAVVIVGIKTAAQAALPPLYSVHPSSAIQYTSTRSTSSHSDTVPLGSG